jgi:DNA-binding response OmpR family regulator
MRVLVVEDDESIAVPLCDGLRREGFDVDRVATGEDALAAALAPGVAFGAVLLDLNLPDLDGLDVCRRVRAESAVPILCLTARSDEAERVAGLDAGADDYIVKPFGFRELVARIHAVTRRGSGREVPDIQRIGDLEIDRRARRVCIGGVDVGLTPKEFGILAALAEDAGAAVEREDLLERVWGGPWYGPTKTLDVHVASLRRKLGDPRWIESVRGVGFRLGAGP